MIISQAFYAKKQYFVPTIASISSVVLNIFLNFVFIFVFHMKSMSIAFATSLSAIFNFWILKYFLNKKFQNIYEKNIYRSFFKISICTGIAAIITIVIGYFIKDSAIYFLLHKNVFFPNKFLEKLNSFFMLSMIFLTTLFIFSYLFKSKEILDLIFYRKSQSEKIGK